VLAVRLMVSGLVQGVGYRESMVAAATMHAVAGWVRNRADGTVEALVQGDPAAVEQVIQWCRRGPRAARVTEVARSDAAVDAGVTSFQRRPSV
jgi:acylphosphatase